MDASIQDLLEQFVREVESDCHEVITKVQHSEAYRALRARAREAFPHVLNFYRQWSHLQERIQEALASLLLYLAQELNLRDPPPVHYAEVLKVACWAQGAYDEFLSARPRR